MLQDRRIEDRDAFDKGIAKSLRYCTVQYQTISIIANVEVGRSTKWQQGFAHDLGNSGSCHVAHGPLSKIEQSQGERAQGCYGHGSFQMNILSYQEATRPASLSFRRAIRILASYTKEIFGLPQLLHRCPRATLHCLRLI